MTSGECFENKWLYMKYIGKYLSAEILLARECSWFLLIFQVQNNVKFHIINITVNPDFLFIKIFHS